MTETAARWIRVSSDNQDEANQVPRVNAYGAGRGYTFAETFELHDRSASKGEHEAELRRAIDGIKDGRYTVIVARHSDRIDRQDRVAEWMALAATFGGRFEFVDEPGLVYNPRDLGAKVLTVISSHVNWEKSDKLGRDVKDAHTARKARGSIVGRVGWGYGIWCADCGDWSRRLECRQHVKIPKPDDLGNAYVKEVYSRALSGQSLRSIARWLSAETGQAISDTGIRNILTNPVYTGRHVYSDGAVCECDSLVTADMQEQVIRALRARLRRGQRGAKTLPALLIPVCLDCGGKAYRTGSKTRADSYAYYCRICRHVVDCEKLDAIVTDAVMTISADEDETALEWVEGSDSASERAEIRRAMRELDPDDDDYLEKATALRDALRALPAAVPGHFEERPTGRTKADAIFVTGGDRGALRELLAGWGVAFARDGDGVRVKVNGGPEFWRSLVVGRPLGDWVAS